MSAPTHFGPSKKRAAKRAAWRARREAVAPREIPAEVRAYDPLVHASYGGFANVGRIITVVIAAVVFHALVVGTLFGAKAIARAMQSDKVPVDEPIEVTIVEPPPPAAEPPPAVVEPEAAKTEEKAPEKPKEPEKKKEPEKPKEKLPPPPDPVNTPKNDQPPPKNDKPARRIVGLNLESTTEGGSGPSFGVGNTRMGETEKVAQNPTDVAPTSKTLGTPEGTGPAENVNQTATRIPTARAKLVVVRVNIDEKGKVVDVTVVAPSPYPELNEAAKAAAKKQEWNPATRDGVPVPTKQTYTFRFRING
ncbi:energy transducer TonB [Myxococcota bacterium]|nr:energy transducer TonB [Myxococcota bacterium]